MTKMTNIQDFFAQFPTDEACLEHLFKERFGDEPCCPKCGECGTFRKLAKIPAYTCNCGHHIHPMVGTPFEKSRTPLQKWFYAMYIFTTTRNGVSAKEIQRQLGVTYKCAWRIGHKLREYMAFADGDAPIGGPGKPIVEADKTFIGGRDKAGHDDKAIVLGMIERGGEVITRVLPDRSRKTILANLRPWIPEGARVATDEGRGFMALAPYGYDHRTVNHRKKEYVRGAVHTNSIEGFWACVKRTIEGTHIWVSKKHLQNYLCEAEFRHNLRHEPHLMFPVLLKAFQRP